MKITHVCIRVLRPWPVGQGHGAAEVEAQLEEGDDPTVVAEDLQRWCETEICKGFSLSTVIGTANDMGNDIASAIRTRNGLRKEVAALQKSIKACEDLVTLAAREGIKLPDDLDPEPEITW